MARLSKLKVCTLNQYVSITALCYRMSLKAKAMQSLTLHQFYFIPSKDQVRELQCQNLLFEYISITIQPRNGSLKVQVAIRLLNLKFATQLLSKFSGLV